MSPAVFYRVKLWRPRWVASHGSHGTKAQADGELLVRRAVVEQQRVGLGEKRPEELEELEHVDGGHGRRVVKKVQQLAAMTRHGADEMELDDVLTLVRREPRDVVRVEAADVLPAIGPAKVNDLLVNKHEAVESLPMHCEAVAEPKLTVAPHQQRFGDAAIPRDRAV